MQKNRSWIGMIALLVVLLMPLSAAPEDDYEITSAMLEGMNQSLASQGQNYRVAVAEYITIAGEEMGGIVISKAVGNKQLTQDFVPFDPRRPWSGAGGALTYAIDTTGDAVPVMGGLGAAATDAAIVRATSTWEGLRCSTLGLGRNPDFGIDIGVVAFLNRLGGSPLILADIQHAGFRDITFGGGIVGVTFTFIFVDADGPTDIDNNGKRDTMFREIYYAPSVPWADDGVNDVDVEAVAAHEIGHGLSQAHFGKVFIDKKGTLRLAPRALMNAVYAGPQRTLLGTDRGGHCNNWAQWPNR